MVSRTEVFTSPKVIQRAACIVVHHRYILGGGGIIYLHFRKFKFVIMLAVFQNTFFCILDMLMNQVVFFKTKLATHSESSDIPRPFILRSTFCVAALFKMKSYVHNSFNSHPSWIQGSSQIKRMAETKGTSKTSLCVPFLAVSVLSPEACRRTSAVLAYEQQPGPGLHPSPVLFCRDWPLQC